MKSSNFLKGFFLLNIIFLASIAVFNYVIDPYWTNNNSHKLNSLQKAPNEREQKTNLLYFKHSSYDGVLLGSSRVTFLNHKDFKDKDIFNYSFSFAMPQNYEKYVEFAKKQNAKDMEYIIIGLDFFGTNKNAKENKEPQEIFDETTSFFYKYKLLLSIDSLKLSLENIKRSLLNKAGGRSYTRENIAFTTHIDEKEVVSRVKNVKVDEFVGNINKYEYNQNYKQILISLKKANPNSKFIIFTTPVTSVYLDKLNELGLQNDYKKWLKQTVEVFGSITHFMDKNSISTNYSKYFMDYHHIYPKYSSYVISKLDDINSTKSPKDFGQILNKDNIDSYLKGLN